MLQSLQSLYEDFITQVVTQPWFYPALIALGVLIVLLLIAGFLRSNKGLRVYRDESGSTHVTQGAIKDLVHLACASVDTATKPRIKVKQRRGRLELQVKVKLYQGQRLNEHRDRLRRNVIRTFEEEHGIRLGDIHVIITGFKKGGPYAPKKESYTEPAMKDENHTPAITDPVVNLESEKKAEPHKHKGPDLSVVSALGDGIGTDHISTTNSPEFVATDEIEPDVASEPKGEKKKSFFGWGKKSELTEESQQDSEESEDKDSTFDFSNESEKK